MRRVALTLLVAALLAPAATADHIGSLYALDHLCVGADGKRVVADCSVEKQTYYRAKAPEGSPPVEASAELDSQRLLLPVGAEIPLASYSVLGVHPYAVLVDVNAASLTYTEPVLDQWERVERSAKERGFDALESTGLHFRLVCGWDVGATRGVCAVYNPEADAETALARGLRDDALSDGRAAIDVSRSEAVRAVAPDLTARIALKSVKAGASVAPPDAGDAAGVPVAAPEPAAFLRGSPDDGATERFAPASPIPTERLATAPAPPPQPPAGTVAEPAPAPPPARILGATAAPRSPDEVPLALVVAAAASGGALVVLLAVLAHRHLTSRNVLGNGTREALFRAVKETPGATISDVARTSRLHHTTATYHLDILEELGLVVAERVGNKKHYFATGESGNHADRLSRLLAGMGRAEAVVRLLRDRPGARPADLAPHLGMTVAGVYWHLKRLEALGVVLRTDGAPSAFRLADRYAPG